MVKLNNFKENFLQYLKEADKEETEDKSTDPAEFTDDSNDVPDLGSIGGSGDAPLMSPGSGNENFDDIDGQPNVNDPQPDPLGTNPKTLKQKPRKKYERKNDSKTTATKALSAVT